MATRRGVRLGVHRLRLEGDLTEIGEPDLRFTVAEARELCGAAGLRRCPMEVGSVTCCAGTKPAGFCGAGRANHRDPVMAGHLAGDETGEGDAS